MKRREFVMLGAASTVCGSMRIALAKDQVSPPVINRKVPPRNRCPYKGLDWTKVERIKTTSHGHCTSQKMLDAYLQRGFGLLTMSNYYPSAPYVPASKMTRNYYIHHHEHPVMVKGKLTPGPFDWNSILEGL